ncbi:mitochondrial carrier, partial [Microstroma glucosiphilum]
SFMPASSRGDSSEQVQAVMANNAEAGPSRLRLSSLVGASSSHSSSSSAPTAAAASPTTAAVVDADAEPLRNPSPASFFPTPALDHAFAGITAGAIATVCMNPLDLIKTQFQVDTGTSFNVKGKGKDVGSGSALEGAGVGARREGMLAAIRRGKVVTDIYGALREIVKRDGFAGLYRGLSPNVVGNSASWGLYFLWYTMIKEHMSLSSSADGTDRNRKLSATQHLLAASESGAVTALMTNPIWVVKTRMFTAPVPSKVPTPGEPPNPYRSLRSSLAHIYTTEGVRGLWKGAGLALFGVSNGAIQFMAYEQLKRYRSDAILLKRGGDVQPEELGSEGQVKLVSSLRARCRERKGIDDRHSEWAYLPVSLPLFPPLSRATPNTSSSPVPPSSSPSSPPTLTK